MYRRRPPGILGHGVALRLLSSHHLSIGLTALTLASGCFGNYDRSLIRDGGPDTGPAVDAGPCGSKTPPAAPGVADTADGPDHHFALRRVALDLVEGGAWRNIGFDLDGVCTRPDDYETECSPPRGMPSEDGNDGIDNTFGSSLFPVVDARIMGLEPMARAAQETGSLPVLRIRHWNQEANDPHVEVAVTNAIFTVPAQPDGTAPLFDVVDFEPVDMMGVRLPFPDWDGEDYAYLRRDTFEGGDPDVPILVDVDAYIADRVLVARIPSRFEILFPADDVGVLVRITDGTLTGRITEDLLTLEDVVVGGRWRVDDLLATAESIGVCRGTDEFDLLSAQLDRLADIRATPGTGGPGVLCNAVSVAVGFSGTAVQVGGLADGPAVRNLCM